MAKTTTILVTHKILCIDQMVHFVTTEPAPNGPYPVFNKILSCFSETMEQNCKSCSRSMLRGEDFDLKPHLEPKNRDMNGI